MKVVISRKYSEKETSGAAVVFNEDEEIYSFKTLELPDKGNQHNVSCIPEGDYEVHKVFSTKRGWCYQVMDVPDRTSILIHIGNYATGVKVDTQGCILVGTKFLDMNGDKNIDIAESTIAMVKLREILPDVFRLYII